MKGLFLDDERNPSDVTWIQYPSDIEWTIVRTHSDFLCQIIDFHFDVISFDHDLMNFVNEKEFTGKDCVNSLIDLNFDVYTNRIIDFPICYYHTQNIIGKENMQSYINHFKQMYYLG